MTLSTTTSRISYPGAGSVGPFAFPFRIFANSDLLVIKRSAAGLDTELVYITDYTVSGAGNATGSVTLVVALAVGETLVIRRVLDLSQPISIRNQGTYFPATIEDEFDRIVMQIQSLQDQIARSIRLSESFDPAVFGPAMQLRELTAGKALVGTGVGIGFATLDAGAIAIPGMGRTVTTLSAYLANNAVLNPKDFGAVFDGLTDDTLAWRACIDEARNHNNQSSIYFPAGQSAIKGTLDVSAVGIFGFGGSLASKLIALPGFVGTEMLLLTDATGAGRASYSGFWIYGDRANVGGALRAITIDGNCISNSFHDLFINQMSGVGVVLDGSAGRIPELTSFERVYVASSSTHGWDVRAGITLNFHACVADNVDGIGLLVSGSGRVVEEVEFNTFWIESPGEGMDAIKIMNAVNLSFRNSLITGYGSNPATTGHGFHMVAAGADVIRHVVIDGLSIIGRAASAAGSRMFYLNQTVRCELRGLPASVGASDIELVGAATDTLILGAQDAAFCSNEQIFATNLTAAIVAGDTRYIAPQNGLVSATEADCSHIVYGRMAIVGLTASLNGTSPPGAGYVVVTLFKNGVATALTATVTVANYVAGITDNHEVDLAPGDNFSIEIMSGASSGGQAVGGIKVTLAVRR